MIAHAIQIHKAIIVAFLFLSAAINAMPGEASDSYDKSMLGALASGARYDKKFAEEGKWPQDLSGCTITYDPLRKNLQGSLIPVDQSKKWYSEKDVREALSTYFVRNGEDWRHTYSHVALSDITGTLILKDKTQLRWLVRPGGLALVLYPDGGIVYLAREITTKSKTVARSAWVKAMVQRTLFKKPGSDRFFVYVRLENKNDKPIGFELNDRWSVFYPNQWADSNERTRGEIDETRRNQPAVSAAQKKRLLEQMNGTRKNANFICIKPHDVFEYFIAFNAGKSSDIDRVKHPYVIIVMDGQMAFTDGKEVEELKRDQNDFAQAEVCMPMPISWGTVPAAAATFDH